MRKRRKQKKDLDKAYDAYIKQASEYGFQQVYSKEAFRKDVYNKAKVRSIKKKNTNFQIGKIAIKMHMSSMSEYSIYVSKFKKARKKGYTLATEFMPYEIFEKKRSLGMSITNILAESYKINMKQGKNLLKEAKQKGIKMSLDDLLKQGEGYKKLMKAIEDEGWDEIEGHVYTDEKKYKV